MANPYGNPDDAPADAAAEGYVPEDELEEIPDGASRARPGPGQRGSRSPSKTPLPPTALPLLAEGDEVIDMGDEMDEDDDFNMDPDNEIDADDDEDGPVADDAARVFREHNGAAAAPMPCAHLGPRAAHKMATPCP